MSRIVNSVKSITEACNEMIGYSIESEFVDVKSLAETLSERVKQLNKLYDEHPELERDISKLKTETEALALRLEFYLDVRMHLYTERRERRKYASKLYEDCRHICEIYASRKTDNNLMLEWYTKTRLALDYYIRSQHIIFEYDEEDEKIIESIKVLMENSQIDD